MPFSDAEGKDWSAERILRARPDEVWDIGPGQGTYSMLLRDQLPGARWVGVEIWEPYVETYDLRSKYDVVVVNDVKNALLPYSPNGLVIFGDVLEHIPDFEDGSPWGVARLLGYAKSRFRYILVSLPIVHSPQGEVFGNPYETHHRDWSFDEMHELMDGCEALCGNTLGVYWWDREKDGRSE